LKKIILLLLIILSITYAKNSVEFKYAEFDTLRKHPTSEQFILSYNNVLKKVRTSVVNISTQKSLNDNTNNSHPLMRDPFFREFFKQQRPEPQKRMQRALGSGVIISSDGYIVTNNHVIDAADIIKVSIPDDNKEYKAKLIGKDSKSDLAIIKIEASNLNAVTFYDSDKVKVGDIAFALGNPFGLGETITQGIVSATSRSGVGIVEYEDFIQTDASINPGNSGGALINSAGHLIGLNAAIISQSGGNVGIGFAIPSNMLTAIATQLIEEGKFTRAYLGVNISDIDEEMSKFYNNEFGALITSVSENTPAAKAGLKRGDLIISVNGKKISSASELKNTIGSFPPSRIINIKFLRDSKIDIINVQLSSRENDASVSLYSFKGVNLENINSDIKSKLQLPPNINGLIVSSLNEDAELKDSGLRKNDIIIQVENIEINTINDFKRATATENKKRFYIYRNGNVFVVVL